MNTIEIRCTEGKQDYIAEMPDGEFTLIIEHPHPNPSFVYRRFPGLTDCVSYSGPGNTNTTSNQQVSTDRYSVKTAPPSE